DMRGKNYFGESTEFTINFSDWNGTAMYTSDTEGLFVYSDIKFQRNAYFSGDYTSFGAGKVEFLNGTKVILSEADAALRYGSSLTFDSGSTLIVNTNDVRGLPIQPFWPSHKFYLDLDTSK